MPNGIPDITNFGDEDHEEGETGLVINGAGFGAFPGTAWIYQNANRTGTTDLLTVATWNDMRLSGVDIPGSPNNATGTVYLFVQREDLAWSLPYAFTLSAAGAGPSVPKIQPCFIVTVGRMF